MKGYHMSQFTQARYNLTQSALSLSSAIHSGANVTIIARLQTQLANAQDAFNEVA